MTWVQKTRPRLTGVAAVAAAMATTFVVALALSGCAAAHSVPGCSDEIAATWMPTGAKRISSFPDKHLLAASNAACFVAVKVDGAEYGEALVFGKGAEHQLTDLLTSRGFTHDTATDTWHDAHHLASIEPERTITADDGVPELTGKTVAVLYVGPVSAGDD